MATFVLIPGAGSDSWYWHRVVPELEAAGHQVVAADLPCSDDAAEFSDYADAVVAAVHDDVVDLEAADLVLVAQSLGGFTAPLVAERLPVRLVVLVAAMVPAPGESAGEWWDSTGWPGARLQQAERFGRSPEATFDDLFDFFHDVPSDVVAAAYAHGDPGQSATPFERPLPMSRWPEVPTRFLLCRQDRFFPADFMREVVRDRLGIIPDEIDAGHLPALSQPRELAAQLLAYVAELDRVR
jgi:pimeloyl-ACP methyl ester carboxylesterase